MSPVDRTEDTRQVSAVPSNSTLIISRREVESLLDLRVLIEGIRKAYIDRLVYRPTNPQRAVAKMGCNSIVINFSGVLPGHRAYTVKTNVKTPSNPGVGLPL